MTEDVFTADFVVERVKAVGRFLLGLGIKLPLQRPDRVRGGWQHGNPSILRSSVARTKQGAQALAAWDTENRFRTLAAQGDVQQALAILDRLDAGGE